MTLRSLALVSVVLTPFVVAGTGTAGTMASATAKPSIHFTPNPVHAGAVVRVHGSAGSCTVGDAVTVLSRAFPHTHTFAGVPAVIATVRPNGNYAKRVRIPLQRRPAPPTRPRHAAAAATSASSPDCVLPA